MTKPKIIIADDSTVIQKAVKIALSHYDVEVMIANDRQKLRELAETIAPDLIFVSAALPGLSADDWLRPPLKAAYQSKCVLMVGSFDETHITPDTPTAAMVLRKPFSSQDVITKMQHFLGELPPTQAGRSDAEQHRAYAATSSGAYADPLSFEPSTLPSDVKDSLNKKMEVIIREYCEKNFKSIAREILQEELRRLTKERTNTLLAD